ncbi:hypothetical protein QYE76_000817 [Lolium multiflorum]|uniref:Uncharacterized protein n=1 Tax=Lolium multiflorum TaxID=4521 RepID=A0AAD8RLT2_LOLMU|nr:hypothetical protein QYE76_000817 [Lolium multiflorum]
MRPPLSSSLRRRLRLPHPVLRRAPSGGTVGLRNPSSRRPVRVRGNRVFGERLLATTGKTTSSDEFPNNDFFLDIDNLFGNLNMGDNNQDAANIAAAAANVGQNAFLSSSFQILLEFLVLLFGVDAIDLIGSLHVEEKAIAKDTRARDFEGGSCANVVQKKNFKSHKFKNKKKYEGKGKFDGKNKASHSTNFKKKTDKKKGASHVCGDPDHWAPNCPNHYDKHGNDDKTANVVIAGDTEMKDTGYGRKDLPVLMGNGSRACSWCWYGKSEVYFGRPSS